MLHEDLTEPAVRCTLHPMNWQLQLTRCTFHFWCVGTGWGKWQYKLIILNTNSYVVNKLKPATPPTCIFHLATHVPPSQLSEPALQR